MEERDLHETIWLGRSEVLYGVVNNGMDFKDLVKPGKLKYSPHRRLHSCKVDVAGADAHLLEELDQ